MISTLLVIWFLKSAKKIIKIYYVKIWFGKKKKQILDNLYVFFIIVFENSKDIFATLYIMTCSYMVDLINTFATKVIWKPHAGLGYLRYMYVQYVIKMSDIFYNKKKKNFN